MHVRHDVAKRTKRPSDKRNIESATYVEAAAAWLALVPRETEFIVPAIERTIGKLKTEFTARTKIKFPPQCAPEQFCQLCAYGRRQRGRRPVGDPDGKFRSNR